MRPRVCFLVGGREGGGSATSILQLLSRIDRAKYDCRVLACEEGPYVQRLRQGGMECDILGTGWPPLMGQGSRHGAMGRLGQLLLLLKWAHVTGRRLRRYVLRNDVRVIHANYHQFCLAGALAVRGTPARCVWHWRGVLRRRVERLFSRFIHWLAGGRAWSIANSQATLDSIAGRTAHRSCVIYNGVATGPLRADRTSLRDLLELPRDVRLVSLVGSLTPLKGHRVFIEAAAEVVRQCPNVRFVCIGSQTGWAGQKQHMEMLEKLRHDLGLDDAVCFLGARSDAADLVADVDVATACTLPPGEGFGLVIIEAMARGVPVISSDVGAAAEILRHKDTGWLVPAGDAQALAGAIVHLLQNENERRAIGWAGQRQCQARFDINRTVSQVQDVYDRLLS